MFLWFLLYLHVNIYVKGKYIHDDSHIIVGHSFITSAKLGEVGVKKILTFGWQIDKTQGQRDFNTD